MSNSMDLATTAHFFQKQQLFLLDVTRKSDDNPAALSLIRRFLRRPFPTSKSSIPEKTTSLKQSSTPNQENRARKRGMSWFDLESHFAFYGAYHSNPINVLIHMMFVWPIAFTLLVILYFTPPLFAHDPIQFGSDAHLVLNYGFLLTLLYSVYYMSLDKKAGSLAALMCFGCWIGSSVLGYRLGFSLSWKVVLASQLLCWTFQFIGHGVFEKRAPALLDNLGQAFLMAPFFVLLEALQSAFGYEPYPGFHAKVQAKIDAEVKAWKDDKVKKAS